MGNFHLPNYLFRDEFSNLTFRHNSVMKVEAAILPLNWAITIQHIAQPVIGRTPEGEEGNSRTQITWDIQTLLEIP
jgi:hypothetical protein